MSASLFFSEMVKKNVCLYVSSGEFKRRENLFLYMLKIVDVAKCKFIIKNSVQATDYVFGYFCDGK